MNWKRIWLMKGVNANVYEKVVNGIVVLFAMVISVMTSGALGVLAESTW